jgi:hypothetical protein
MSLASVKRAASSEEVPRGLLISTADALKGGTGDPPPCAEAT